jgi:hypothetical protein
LNVLETEWWTMALPPEWWAESEDDSILVGDRDDVGCLELSDLHKEDGDFELDELRSIAQDESATTLVWKTVTLGDFEGVVSDFIEEGAAVREWYIAHKTLLLYVTYSCEEENRGMDDSAVDQLLDTLLIVEK